MADEKKIDPMEEPQEVTELEDDELQEVAGGLTVADVSGSTSIGFPDVCKTPAPGPFVPVPYPNVTQKDGSTPVSKDPRLGSVDRLRRG